MSLTDFRFRLRWPAYSESLEKLKPSRSLFRNFQSCPHCEKRGPHPFVERINDCATLISRSDGETFHLVLGDRPIAYPAEKSPRKTNMVIARFWYVKERNEKCGMLTGTVIIMLRKPPDGIGLFKQLEIVADRLVDKINETPLIETFYEFDGDRLSKVL